MDPPKNTGPVRVKRVPKNNQLYTNVLRCVLSGGPSVRGPRRLEVRAISESVRESVSESVCERTAEA